MNTEILLVTEEKIIAATNGKTIEIDNDLEELRKQCRANNTKEIQVADNIYNIGNIENAEFRNIMDVKGIKINAIITSKIINKIAKHNIEANRFITNNSNNDKWQYDDENATEAKNIILENVIGSIAIQLNLLFSAGTIISNSPKDIDEYIKRSVNIYENTLDLLSYILISTLLKEKKDNLNLKLSPGLKEEIARTLQNWVKPEDHLIKKLNLLKIIIENWPNNIAIFPSEFADFTNETFIKLQKINNAIAVINNKRNMAKITLKSCEIAENKIADFLSEFSFLANYGMASFKQIGFKQIKRSGPNYIHRYARVGTNKKSEEKYRFSKESNPAATVVIFKGNNFFECTSLFPFIIDFNSITKEENEDICHFIRAREKTDQDNKEIRLVEYLSIHNGRKEEITKELNKEFTWDIRCSEEENHMEYFAYCIEQELKDILEYFTQS